MPESEIHHVLIIGSGPAGWAAATYLARAQLKPLVLAGEKSGGQLMLTTEVENYPGFPAGVMGPDLMLGMRAQAEKFGTVVLDKHVTKVDFSKRPFSVWVGEQQYKAKAVLVATGAESVWLNVPGEHEFTGRGVSTCAVCDAAFFRNKNTYVVGGGDSAMEDTLALTKFASSVTLIHRRDAFKASKIMQERVLQHPKVKVMWNSAITEIKGAGKVTSIIVENVVDNTSKELPADGVFVAIGHKPVTDLFAGQLQVDAKKYLVTRLGLGTESVALATKALTEQGFVAFPTMTSVEGVFGAGDVADFRYRQAATAAGMGVMASLDIERWLESQE